mmetsp:Transcript_31733/g.111763  ORF Transcript_31733/g.111763 Transcript_31733/m.111763 type:complete len:209 (+) Transcript_31733:139-765(+)
MWCRACQKALRHPTRDASEPITPTHPIPLGRRGSHPRRALQSMRFQSHHGMLEQNAHNLGRGDGPASEKCGGPQKRRLVRRLLWRRVAFRDRIARRHRARLGRGEARPERGAGPSRQRSRRLRLVRCILRKRIQAGDGVQRPARKGVGFFIRQASTDFKRALLLRPLRRLLDRRQARPDDELGQIGQAVGRRDQGYERGGRPVCRHSR